MNEKPQVMTIGGKPVPPIKTHPNTGDRSELAAVAGSAEWVVSLVMIRDVSPGVQNIANYLDTFAAVSREEAVGKSLEAVKMRMPEHRLHVYTALPLPNPPDSEP